MKSERNATVPIEPKPMRAFRLIGAIAAFLAVVGICIMVIWFLIRAPRF